MALVLDTGPLVAALDRRDRAARRCRRLLLETRERLVIPVLVLGEVEWFLRRHSGGAAWTTLIDDAADGLYQIAPPEEADLTRAAELERQYADLGLGIVDASVIALCERLGETKVATLDHRHFSVVRPLHCERLELLPG